MVRIGVAALAAVVAGGALLAPAVTPADRPEGEPSQSAATSWAEPDLPDRAARPPGKKPDTPKKDKGPRHVVDGRLDDWAAPSSSFGGTTQIVDGELVHQDYIYDDYGADTRDPRAPQEGIASWDKTAGEFRYPANEDRFADNAADIDQVRLAMDAAHVHVLLRFNTLRAPDTTVATIAFDVDGDDTTGGGPWPFAAGLSTPGSDVFLTVWGTGGAVSTAGSPPVDLAAAGGQVAVDTETNAIEVAVPRDALPGQQWVLYAASGLWDAEGGEWMAVPGDPPTATSPGHGSRLVASRAFNVAFRPQEHRRTAGLLVGPRGGTGQGAGGFFDDEQAAALAAGDISDFSLAVDVATLEGGATELYHPEPGRFHEVVIDQSFTIPPLDEGRTFENPVPGRNPGGVYGSGYHFFGRRQPFGLYIPESYDGETALPAVLALHGRGGNHRTFASSPGFIADVGEAEPTIIVSPLGRGQWNMYTDYGEKDVLEVLDWVLATLPVDESALYLCGYSMGGYGTLRLGSLYPDRFAATVDWTGYSGEILGHSSVGSAWRQYLQDAGGFGTAWGERSTTFFPYASGNPVDFLEGMRHVPLLKLAGTNDEAMPIISQVAVPLRLDELGYEHRFHLYPGYDHFAFALADEWSAARTWMSRWRRDPAPRHVTYKFSEALGHLDLGILHGNAYWLSGMRVRELVEPPIIAYGSIDATSHAIAGQVETPRRVREPRPGPPPFVEMGTTIDRGDGQPVANALDLAVQNLSEVGVDLARATISPTEPVALTVGTDGPVLIRLLGWTAAAPTLAGGEDGSVRLSHDPDASVVTIELDVAGTYALELVAAG